MRGQRASLNETGDGEVDEHFWAQAAADQAAGRAGSDGDEGKTHPVRLVYMQFNCCSAGDGSGIPFNTQFFHDDDDDGPGFDDGFDGDLAGTADPGEQDLLAETQGKTRRVRPEFVNYTKRAKRVDVRKLKENIWKGLRVPTYGKKPDDAEAMVRDSFVSIRYLEPYSFLPLARQDIDETLGTTDPEEARTFDDVIVGLQRSYPEDKLSEISTSFCFICLLHLANERGLKLETGDVTPGPSTVQEVEEGDNVGNIWSLKVSSQRTASDVFDSVLMERQVYKDLNATPAA